ncbi:MAG: glycosyltransferase [Oliverpabstia sp.]
MRYLILLNRRFPYKYGEAFLENEIDEISSFFDKIIIFPSDMTPNDPITRKIKSPNVYSVAFENQSLRYRKMQYAFMGLPLIRFGSGKKIKQCLFDAYFNAACKSQYKKIAKILDEYHFGKDDEVILYSYWLYISAKVAVDLKQRYKDVTNIKCISRAHAFDIYENKRYLPEREYILSGLDGIYPCSDNGTNYLQEKYPLHRGKIKTSYLGTYDKGIAQQMKSDTFSIVSCSRIAPEKRLELIIDSLELLKDCGVSLEWTHFGGGDTFEDIKKRAEEKLGFMKVNLKGSVLNLEILKSYENKYYNMFINTSSAEGLPVSIMEACSFGIPVIATDVGGTSEIALDGIIGFLLEANPTPQTVADAILKMIQMDPEAYAVMRKNARTHWEENFEAKKNYREFSEQLLAL